MHPKELCIEQFTYELPQEKIAFHPLENRDAARLLVYDGGVKTAVYANIAHHIPTGSLMVFNNTKVVAARLLFTKGAGGVIEVFCLQPHEAYADITSAMHRTGGVQWLCLVGGVSKWKDGQTLQLSFEVNGLAYWLRAELTEKMSNGYMILFSWNNTMSFAEVLYWAGHIPLPPYIKRKNEPSDKTRYQTVFAAKEGSVAAPTAGLHFTAEVLASLGSKNIATEYLTLHVGAGTFMPVKAPTMQEHDMHWEYIEVPQHLVEQLLDKNHSNVVAVGTTSLRTLESLYWMGAKILAAPAIFDEELPWLSQWEAYEAKQHPSTQAALHALLGYMNRRCSDTLVAKTQIIIAPGYSFKIIDGLVTNFHQPASTLLLLVAALIGEDWRQVYQYALNHDFRFLSYGDGSLLWKRPH